MVRWSCANEGGSEVADGLEHERREKARTASLVVLATLALIVVLATDRGSEFFVPIVFTLVLYALFQPVVRWLQRMHIPAWVGSAVVVLGGMAAGGGGGLAPFPPGGTRGA